VGRIRAGAVSPQDPLFARCYGRWLGEHFLLQSLLISGDKPLSPIA
jgi:hypothetical protein